MIYWPRYLPDSPQAFSEQPAEALALTSAVTNGLPKTRRLFTKGVRTFNVTFQLTWSQLEDLRAWIDGPLDAGVNTYLGVDWTSPKRPEVQKQLDMESLTYRWLTGEVWEASFKELVF